jgi:hypothetical protein
MGKERIFKETDTNIWVTEPNAEGNFGLVYNDPNQDDVLYCVTKDVHDTQGFHRAKTLRGAKSCCARLWRSGQMNWVRKSNKALLAERRRRARLKDTLAEVKLCGWSLDHLANRIGTYMDGARIRARLPEEDPHALAYTGLSNSEARQLVRDLRTLASGNIP